MAPIRRYLRISKHSVLECRIYLDSPSDNRWLLNPRDPMLPRVFEAIRPLVLPKLREENERLWARKKSKPVKDVIAEDEFEVAIFLRESRTRHSLLTRQKTFEQPGKKEDASADTKLGKVVSESATDTSKPIDVEVIPDSDEEPEFDLRDIPQAEDELDLNDTLPRRKRRRVQADSPESEDKKDEKKLRFQTHYESFNICGWVLCLLITRKGDRARPSATTEPKQPLMEEWISTQAQTVADDE